MAKQVEVKVPDIGDFDNVPVIEVLVKVGDQVDKEAPLVTLESDKATMEVPSPQAGKVSKISVKEGDNVSEGSVLLLLDADDDDGQSPKSEDTSGEDDAEQPAAKAEPDEDKTESSTADAREDAPQKPSKAAAGGGGGQNRAVTVPDIGDFDNIPVIEILVKAGDRVDKDAPLITLESDKATMEVPAPAAGTVRNIKLKEGDSVSKGDAICDIETEAGADDDAEKQAAPAKSTAEAPTSTAKADDADADPDAAAQSRRSEDESPSQTAGGGHQSDSGTMPHASPSVRKFARELGVELSKIRGSGPHDRILREDVQAYVKKALDRPPTAVGASGIPAIPAVDFSKFGPIERKPLARIRKLSAAHLHRSWLNLPHVTQNDETDITDLEAFRHAQNSKRGVKLTLLPFVLKAVAHAIGDYPEFAASLDADGEHLVMKQYRHIGFAADTDHGLVVPVVRDVDRKGIVQLARETAELAGKARDGKLKPDEMKGGVFSVSSLGGIGGSHFTPIINAPEVGILGVSRAVMKPVWDGEAFRPRLMLPLSLSYDHRVIDGAYAARFIVRLGALLSDLRRLTL